MRTRSWMGSSLEQLRCGMRSRLALNATRNGYQAWPRLARLLAGGRQAQGHQHLREEGRGARALNREFDRIRLGASYRAPITLRELPIGGSRSTWRRRRRSSTRGGASSGRWRRWETPRRET